MTTFEGAVETVGCWLHLVDLDGRVVSDRQPVTWVEHAGEYYVGLPLEFSTDTPSQPAGAVLTDRTGRGLDIAPYSFGVWVPGELVVVTPRVRVRVTSGEYRSAPTQEGPIP